MKKILKIFIFIFIFLLSFMLVNTHTNADTGPKPYVRIEIEGKCDGYFMTLLSKTDSTGPHSANSEYQSNVDNIDLKFASYVDSDNFYYLYTYQDIKDGNYRWGYYPPKEFKILIYDSINDRFITNNEIYERTKFATELSLTLNEDSFSTNPFIVKESNKYTFRVILGFFARLCICLLIELVIALFFKFQHYQLLLITITNVVTQVLLNIALGVFIYNHGLNMWGIIPIYVFSEILIVIIEAVIYCLLINKVDKDNIKPKLLIIGYTLFANVSSLVLGFMLLNILGF